MRELMSPGGSLSVPDRSVDAPAQSELSRRIWDSRYRQVSAEGLAERSLAETWERVADSLAAVESAHRERWRGVFRAALAEFKFLPGGRILAGAGAARNATLANCFVVGTVEGSIDSVFDRLKESALTMQMGGGIGVDFSTLPPRGTDAAGPLAYMRIWDAMCESIAASGARRGAMMGTLRCDHPDIEEFIEAKRRSSELRNFDLSVLVTDEFMSALAEDREWLLGFPGAAPAGGAPVKRWPGFGRVAVAGVRLVRARELWQRLVDCAYEVAEPGVLFIDRINRANNLYYCEELVATNPCGEVPLPPHGACVLGSLNLTAFVHDAYGARARVDEVALAAVTATAVRMLDNAVDACVYPLGEQADQARLTRRVGLGITGLADALAMLGLRYDRADGRAMARRVVAWVRDAAYRASCSLAQERGAFPKFVSRAYLDGEYVRSLPADIRDSIAETGIRNSHLLAIAPTGTVSLLANNVSSGVEPIFALESERRVVDEYGTDKAYRVLDNAFALWQGTHDGPAPEVFVTATEISPEAHLEMVAALQPLVDGAISKTINVPPDLGRQSFAQVFERAYALGVKGCTVFRPNETTGAVLRPVVPRCCGPGPRSH
jgi:ribonucleoside-diphosphate reductase alpha chain